MRDIVESLGLVEWSGGGYLGDRARGGTLILAPRDWNASLAALNDDARPRPRLTAAARRYHGRLHPASPVGAVFRVELREGCPACQGLDGQV